MCKYYSMFVIFLTRLIVSKRAIKQVCGHFIYLNAANSHKISKKQRV